MSEVIVLGTGTDARPFPHAGLDYRCTGLFEIQVYLGFIQQPPPPTLGYLLGEPWFRSYPIFRFYSLIVSPVIRRYGGGACSSPNHSKWIPKEPHSSCFNRTSICSFLAKQMCNGSQVVVKTFPIILLHGGFRCLTWSIMSTCPRTAFWWV